ncbi:MAG TPA: SAM-dependent methyltransferase [Verrucomicrobiota bacterium]|nr:SAM-dependent methyltransferase [Verrucomicrobiota bacterium]
MIDYPALEMPANSTIPRLLRQTIEAQGPISFARFMTLALYHPQAGYYEQHEDRLGRRGDYYTSASAGSLFGELLARRFSCWSRELKLSRFSCVEAGAHNGALADDILTAWSQSESVPSIPWEYWILEPSPRRQAWQRTRLQSYQSRIRWITGWDEISAHSIDGFIFSNELLDAFPVHRLGWDASRRRWFEWGVAIDQDSFSWVRLPGSPRCPEPRWLRDGSNSIGPLPSELLDVLPDGFTVETNPQAEQWWEQAAQRLRSGFLLAFDYGMEQEKLFAPERGLGTLQAYHCHQTSRDVLSHPGSQDLTSQVNFTLLRALGEGYGLRTMVYSTQSRFLVENLNSEEMAALGLDGSHPSRLGQFKTLTHPDHLGQTLKVLVQRRDA